MKQMLTKNKLLTLWTITQVEIFGWRECSQKTGIGGTEYYASIFQFDPASMALNKELSIGPSTERLTFSVLSANLQTIICPLGNSQTALEPRTRPQNQLLCA